MQRLLIALALAQPPEGEIVVQQPAEARPWALEWSAPDTCPARDEVVAAIREYLPELDAPPLEVGHADLRLAARVEAEAGGWRVHLRTSGREGDSQRELAAPDCESLAAAVALIAAVALDPVLTARRAREALVAASSGAEDELENEAGEHASALAGDVQNASESIAITLAPIDPEPAAERVRSRRVGLGASLRGGGGYGPTTAGFGFVGAGFALFAGRFRWQLDAGLDLPRTLALDDGRRGRVLGWWVGSSACVVPRVRALELPLCLGFEGGLVHARGLAPTANTRTEQLPWLAPRLGPGLRFAVLPRLALLLDLELLVPLVRAGFEIDDVTLTRLPPLALRGAAGIELRW